MENDAIFFGLLSNISVPIKENVRLVFSGVKSRCGLTNEWKCHAHECQKTVIFGRQSSIHDIEVNDLVLITVFNPVLNIGIVRVIL